MRNQFESATILCKVPCQSRGLYPSGFSSIVSEIEAGPLLERRR